MASENIMMAGVKAGGNRQDLHERIRLHSHAAAAQVKNFGKPNDLISRLKADIAFRKVDFERLLRPENYIGRAPKQVDEFLAMVVTPIRKKYHSAINKKVELDV